MSTERCYKCRHPRYESDRQCTKCGTDFWCRWDPALYKGRLTRISLGQDSTGRTAGNYFAIGTVLLLTYGLVVRMYYAHPAPPGLQAVLALFIGLFGAYEVWAYFHGRATSIDHITHEPRLENTVWRSVGLIGDIFFVGFALHLLYDLSDA